MRGALKPLPGIANVAIEVGQTEFSVDYDPDKTDVDKIMAAISAAGEGVTKKS